jgi:hypothetical protein
MFAILRGVSLRDTAPLSYCALLYNVHQLTAIDRSNQTKIIGRCYRPRRDGGGVIENLQRTCLSVRYKICCKMRTILTSSRQGYRQRPLGVP